MVHRSPREKGAAAQVTVVAFFDNFRLTAQLLELGTVGTRICFRVEKKGLSFDYNALIVHRQKGNY